MLTNESIGAACARWRIERGYRQYEVAKHTGYRQCTVSKFEHGKNDNMCILCWYIKMGFDIRGFLDGAL